MGGEIKVPLHSPRKIEGGTLQEGGEHHQLHLHHGQLHLHHGQAQNQITIWQTKFLELHAGG